ELAPRGREVAVRDVDRDALLALGAQAVGEEREVHVAVAALGARALDRRVLVLEDLLRVVEEPADERALAVVDRARRGHPQHPRVADLLGERGGGGRAAAAAESPLRPAAPSVAIRSSPRACGPPSRPPR